MTKKVFAFGLALLIAMALIVSCDSEPAKPATPECTHETTKYIEKDGKVFQVCDCGKEKTEIANAIIATPETITEKLESLTDGDFLYLSVGTYNPFIVEVANVTIAGTIGETQEESTVILSLNEVYQETNNPYNLRLEAENITVDGIWFDATKKQEKGDWRAMGAFFAESLNHLDVKGNNPTIKNSVFIGSGEEGSIVSLFYGQEFSFINNRVENFERGIYIMGDWLNNPKFTFNENELTKVLIPFDFYISNPLVDGETYVNIIGNKTNDDLSYLQVWDYAQWRESKTGLKNVKIKDNTGKFTYYLTHVDVCEKTGYSLEAKENQTVTNRIFFDISYYVDVNDIKNFTVVNEDGSPIPSFNPGSNLAAKDGKAYIYAIAPGNYQIVSNTDEKEPTKVTVEFKEPIANN